MPRAKPLHLHPERTRHGRLIWYVRKQHSARIRLHAEYGSQEFWAEYRAALEGAPKPQTSPQAHTLAWSLARYRESSAWAALSNATRRQSENIYRAVIETAGAVPLRQITAETIKAARERRQSAPHAANNFLKSMRRFFKWAADPEAGNLVPSNPTIGVKLLRGRNRDGFHLDRRRNRTLRAMLAARHARAARLRSSALHRIEPRRRRSARAAACQRRRDHLPNGEEPRRGDGLSADIAAARALDRGRAYWRPHVPGDRARRAVRQRGLRQLVSRGLPQGMLSGLSAWLAQGRCNARGRERRDGQPTDGAVRMEDREDGAALHAQGGSQTARATRRTAAAQSTS
jgi:hypothetical protein